MTGFTVTGRCPNDPANVNATSAPPAPAQAERRVHASTRHWLLGIFHHPPLPWPQRRQCCVPRTPTGGNDVTIEFWINAFIPLSVPGVTMPYPADTIRA